MTIHEHFTEFAGLPVADYSVDGAAGEDAKDVGRYAWRVFTEFESSPFDEVFAAFLDEVDAAQVTALLIGYWGASYDDNVADPVELLVKAKGRLPALRALFLGDMVMEESEISWIEHSDITPLLTAFPRLERLGVRGSAGLVLEPVRAEHLRELRMESGGLPSAVVRAVGASDLPNLEHLELWLGVENYGGDATVADLAPILGGERLPSLRHLGLQNAEIQDEVAAAVASAPIVARLESLSLSMGTMTDVGAEALLSGQPLTHLRELDLRHHYLSDAMMERLRAALPGVEVDLDEQETEDADDWRYVEVSE